MSHQTQFIILCVLTGVLAVIAAASTVVLVRIVRKYPR